jgi:hypothetical protein
MFCEKCGNQMADDVAFCHKCGTKVMGAEASPFASVEKGTTTPSMPIPVATTETVKTSHGRNEVTIHGYHKVGDFENKIKVFRNGKLVGKIGPDETITVPNDSDGTFLFQYLFSKSQCTVKAGSGELQLEWDFGKLKVFDLSSGEHSEKIEKIKKNNKKWALAGAILLGICAVARLIGFFMR